MKQTIRGKYTLLFASVMGTVILFLCLANTMYLEKYYVSQKTNQMVEVADSVDELLAENSMEDTTTQGRLFWIFEKGNVSAIIGSEDQTKIWTFGYTNRLENQMRALIYSKGMEAADILEQSEDHVVCRWYDSDLQAEYILFLGFLKNGGFCFLRSSLPGIRESARISTRFTWIIGLTGILVGLAMVAYTSRKVSKPIVELANIADRMAHLDFSARYTENRQDEIGVLGTSMNHMSEELEKTIYNLRRANEQLRRDIEEKVKVDEMRKEFISSVSHELKTPIALIQGYAEGLLDGIADDPESARYYCEVIVDEADKMNQLVRKLLTLNQIESGINTVELVDFDLIPVISSVLHTFAIKLQQKEITVEFNEDQTLMVRADEFMMEEVIRNYISNAINHIDGERRIRIHTDENENRISVSVFNTGKPIPEESLEQVWQKFYKVDKARTREYGGSGIGLSIVKAAIDSHGGRCGVYNTDDGVCFWFELSKLVLPAVQPGVNYTAGPLPPLHSAPDSRQSSPEPSTQEEVIDI